jgi:hypothetical protein
MVLIKIEGLTTLSHVEGQITMNNPPAAAQTIGFNFIRENEHFYRRLRVFYAFFFLNPER